MPSYPVIDFHQYQASHEDDRLLLFAAPANVLWRWAGIPRQGWRVRMLYQRWITEARKQEVTAFWEEAAKPRDEQPKRYIVGPTALTLAMLDEPVFDDDGHIVLDYERPFQLETPTEDKLRLSAEVVLSRMLGRLTEPEVEIFESFRNDVTQSIPDVGSDYVLESMCQVAQMSDDPEYFLSESGIDPSEVSELIQSLEALARPALVVDGQHRLYGAAHADADIILPAVAIPNCPWMEQIYQFVVINDKAQRVPGPLLTDIFGSSLTPSEQQLIRGQLDRSGVRVEERIAAVIAARDEASPFYNLVKITLPGDPPSGVEPFIPETTIRQLIEGGRGTRSWRTDEEFYHSYVAPTFPDRAEWDSWTTGKWRDYWFAFWSEVRDFYNAASSDPLWGPEGQSNLTKAVTLRLFQRLFIEAACERMQGVSNARETLVSVLGEEEAEARLSEQIAEKALPADVDDFRTQVRTWFLQKGVPVRVFEKSWRTSLDDQSGQEALYDELEKAFRKTQAGEMYVARNADVYAVE